MVLHKLATFLTIAVTMSACVTGQSGRQPESTPVGPNYNLPPSVHQTNGRDILSPLNRDRWIQIRASSDSDHVKLYSSLGTREWDVAINDARAYLAEHPKDRVAMTVLAIGLSMQQNYSLAAYYGNLIERYYPGYPETANLQGLAILNRPGASYQDFRKAAQYFETAFNQFPNQVASGLNLGHLYLDMANATAARDVFRIVQQRCGDCVEALLGYGIASSRLKDFEQAEETFAKILKQSPNHLTAKYYLALVVNYGKKKPQEAVAILENLLEDSSDENLEIKRKANFLMRRLEAQLYADLQIREKAQQLLDSNSDMITVLDSE